MALLVGGWLRWHEWRSVVSKQGYVERGCFRGMKLSVLRRFRRVRFYPEGRFR